MEQTSVKNRRERPGDGPHGGPKYCVNVEGTEHTWPRDSITTEEIAQLGGWDPAVGVIEIDRDNNERLLEPGEVVKLRPGHGFCRRIRFKRGLSPTERAGAELALLTRHFPATQREGVWFRIRGYSLPTGWNVSKTDVAFRLNDGHPAAPPYGIYVPLGLRVNGRPPSNYTEPAKHQPPFGGTWAVFSWQPEGWRGYGGSTDPHPVLAMTVADRSWPTTRWSFENWRRIADVVEV